LFNEAIRVLIVEDSNDYAYMLQMVLRREDQNHFVVQHARQLSQCVSFLEDEQFNVILLDLTLPDSDGFNTFMKVHDQAPETPIVVLTALDDQNLALAAVREGAQDFLIKGSVEGRALVRALRYAIERKRMLTELQQQTIMDELTGLLNRRGFFSMAQPQMEIANRSGSTLSLFFADLDGLKRINDQFGHLAGDQALKAVAGILRETFRSSDIIARIGGDEFTILALLINKDIQSILQRLRDSIEEHNRQSSQYQLSLSVGVAFYEGGCDGSLDDLLSQADASLYQEKQSKYSYR
jgi:diguanylate cyclase (GGDEF)-like protein